MNMEENAELVNQDLRIEINYQINQEDFLEHQLFIASKFVQNQRRRQKNKILVPSFYVICGIILYFFGAITLTIIFLVFALLWYIYYPAFEGRRFSKYYNEFINENFKDKFGKSTTLMLNKDLLYSKDAVSECKYQSTEVSKIQEIPSTIFIFIKGGTTYILPKDQFENLEELKIQLQAISSVWNVKYENDEGWKWK